MKSRNRAAIGIGLTALTAAVGLAFADQLPARVAIHFGSGGQPNNYASKQFALVFVPVVQLAMLGLFSLLPRIDPLGKNIREFRRAYDAFVLLLVGFLGYVHALVVLWNLGFEVAVTRALVPANAVLYYAIGEVIGRAEQNWFVGIRTPWTLSNEEVWKDTHALGGKLMKAAGVVTLGGFVFPDAVLLFLVVPVTAVAIFTTVYSYWDYRKKTNNDEPGDSV